MAGGERGRRGAGARRTRARAGGGGRRPAAGAPRLSLRALAAALALLLAGCGERARLDALPQGPRLKAERALAGDRLAVEGGREVRLAGIEAPAPDAPWGAAARAALQRMAAGKRVDLLYGGAAADGAGAALAQVRVADGPWLQAAMLEAGLARFRPRPGERAMADDLLAHEARARARRRGLWSDGAYAVRLPDEFGWSDRGLQLVEGRVHRAGRHGGSTYLDFARDYRGRVSAEIDAKSLRDWRAAGRDPEALQGKLVRVRGPVDGFHLTVEAPEAVEQLRER